MAAVATVCIGDGRKSSGGFIKSPRMHIKGWGWEGAVVAGCEKREIIIIIIIIVIIVMIINERTTTN